MAIIIKRSGMLTTVQDMGRNGRQKYGVTTSGAMDLKAYVLSNLLVGNDGGAATLEITVLGPSLEFTEPCAVAITGGDLSPCINGRPIHMYQAISVSKGDVMEFNELKSGCRAYVAFTGGLDVPMIMGSRSTDIRAKMGGYSGRALRAGDVLNTLVPYTNLSNIEKRQIDFQCVPEKIQTIRVLMGPQLECFTSRGRETFLNAIYEVTSQSDRMGYRLDGNAVEHGQHGDIISDGVAAGAIQIPPNGKPIIMLADRQTVGGYAKIANAISVDLSKLAQCKPGDKIKFEEVSIEDAQQLWREERAIIKNFACRLKAMENGEYKTYRVRVDGISYEVEISSRNE